ncbi:MBL fold metallo-hydrolase [Polymorphum gilvum]|uniref:Metal dependent beta lactamase protein n=1 Tax=Polymorphum gilvum (strain LMG 25793 / CGMCC 1.9160 / SL003B-26A1) TaxID=991905 RepID=F2J4G0_POLGS|nr:MBL fold metallo-hydrolase [Polymorphum gilvum]ADZ71102.1 Metal dependent beta lactamase protein [Polymorphum gilvum SL003B-26A1]
MAEDFLLRIWGARGSTPTPGHSTLRYGGETTCLEIRAGDALVLVDCGSGARNLGGRLVEEGPRAFDLLFTHTHLDHICGMPFFKPAYVPGFGIDAWAGHFQDRTELVDIICRIMSPPIFPVAATTLKAVSFRKFQAGDVVPRNDGLVIRTVRLNHPGGACGYRFDHAGKSICIITDHEHGDPAIDAAVRAFVVGADVMIYDAMFTDAEYETYRGWGHSTWQKGVELALAAGVRTPVLFHHDPRRTDDDLDAIGREARLVHPGVVVAAEGMVLRP